MIKEIIILMILCLPFILGSQVEFNKIDFTAYSYSNDIFSDYEEIPPFFININSQYSILFDDYSSTLKSFLYDYYSTDYDFYTINSIFYIDDIGSYSDSYFGYMIFTQPILEKNIRILYYNNAFRITQSAGLLLCENGVTNSKIISEEEYYNIKIYVKNETGNYVTINMKTWAYGEEEPLYYYNNCSLSTGDYSQFGTFGIFGKNAYVEYLTYNITGVNLAYTAEQEQDNSAEFLFLIIIGIYFILLIGSIILYSGFLLMVTSVYGVFVSVIYLIDINSVFGIIFLGTNALFLLIFIVEESKK